MAVLGAGCGCASSPSKEAPSENRTEPSRATNVDDAGTTAPKGHEPVQQDVIGTIQRHYASELHCDDPAHVEVEIYDEVLVPGITVFVARRGPDAEPKIWPRGASFTRGGIVEAGEIYSETEAISRVLRAWDYGKKRTVTATDFAKVAARLYDEESPGAALTDSLSLQIKKRHAAPGIKSRLALPQEVVIDGFPAVKFQILRGNPIEVTVIVRDDFDVDLASEKLGS